MKAFLILFSILLCLSQAKVQASSYIRIDSAMENSLNESIKNIVKEALDEDDRDEGVTPTVAGMRSMFFDLMFDLYLAGYISTAEYEQLKVDYNALEDLPPPEGGWLDRMIQERRIRAHFQSFFAAKFASFKATPEKCIEYLGIANHGQCCNGLVVAPHVKYNYPSNSCKKESVSCSKHSECCTGVCRGLEENGSGQCEPVKTCFQPIETGKKCDPINNPVCKDSLGDDGDKGIVCLKIDYNSSNANTCAREGDSCTTASDCCSDECSGGKCVENYQCKKCRRSGESPVGQEVCCPGFYKSFEGKCIQDWPPFILPQTTSKLETKKESLFSLILSNLFINIAFADETATCVAPCNHVSHLPQSERKEIEEAQKECIQLYPQGDARKDCLKNVVAKELAFYQGHKDNGTITESQSTKDQQEYVDEYNIPHVTARGLSDVKTCRFNSLKDDWHDASLLEKNAEVTLRAFEYVYSGNGADWWKEGGQANPSLFERLHKASTNLRHNRSKYIEALKENDKEMTCLCIAAFGGVTKFPDRKEFFSQNCGETEELAKGLGIQDNGGNDVSGQDGSASNEDQGNNIDNLNQGATGLSHQKLLVTWLERRAAIQMERFKNNVKDVEKGMQETLDYVRTEPWNAPENTELRDNHLYDYAVKWTAGWVSFVIVVIVVIVAVVLTIVTFGGATALFAVLGATITVGTAAVVAGAAIIGVATALLKNPNIAPNKYDKKIISNKCWNRLCTAKFDGFKRYLVYPYSKVCDINGPTSMCLKNAFVSTKSRPEDKVILYLIDIQSPLFINPNNIKYNINFAGPGNSTMVNKAFTRGYNLLKQTHPHKTKNKPRWNGWYARRSEKYKDRDIFLHYFYNNTDHVVYNTNNSSYKPIIMSFSPENFDMPLFNDNMKKEFINGVKKYAKCYKLKDCLKDLGITGNYYHNLGGIDPISELGEDDIGLKLFFADGVTGQVNEEEINAFAEYAYQLHFLWPNTSEENTLSYPLPGMVPYLELILYNVKLLGSLQAERSDRYFHTAEAYADDWNQKFEDYEMAGGNTGLGEKSKNAKFGKKFFAKFRTLDLKGGGNIQAYQNMLDEAVNSGEFNSAELSALRAGVSKAIRASKDKKRYAHYQNTVGKTERGKKTIDKAKEFMQRFNSPIDSFPHIAGSRFNSGNENKLSSNKPKASPEKKPEVASYTPPTFPTSNYATGSSSYGSGYSPSSNQLNKDISNTEVEHMIMSSEKDKSLYENDPSDTLFIKVSKAYKRNLDRVLVRKNDLASNSKNEQVVKPAHSAISEEQKESLKNLLEKN